MRTIRTIVVDDEEMIRNGIARLIRGCGDEWEIVQTCSDGREALDYLLAGKERIDLLITDVKMPEMDGLTLINEAKRHDPSLMAVVISGYDDFQYAQEAIRQGVADYLLKPIDRALFRQLMAAMKEKIEKARYRSSKWNELEQQSETLAHTKQIQLLSYVTSAGLDIHRLGYWVEEFPKGGYLLINIQLDPPPVKTRGYNAKDWEQFGYAIENIIGELTSKHAASFGGSGWCWRGSDTHLWVLLHDGGKGRVHADTAEGELLSAAAGELTRKVRETISQLTPFTVSAAYGEPIEDLYMLEDAKRQAESLMQYRLIEGGNRSFHAERQAPGKGIERMDAGLGPLAERLKQAVLQPDETAALALAQQCFERLERLESPTAMMAAAQNVYVLLHTVGFEHDLSLQPASLEAKLSAFRKLANLSLMRREVESLIKGLTAAIADSRSCSSVGNQPITQAKLWIDGHLAEELSIKKIADHVFMNPSYFCRVFKQQTGETILDYITRERMGKAKKLLRNPQLKLYDISTQVGYQDVKYFSRLFKQTVGETPSKYRELQQQQPSE